MALITCAECGKEVSNKAASCPNCGNPINVEAEEYLCCPKCFSKELHSEHKGFSGGKALAGAVLTGGIGILAGTIGSKTVQVTCLKCGNKFKAGDALLLKSDSETMDNELKKIIEEEGLLKAITKYKEETNASLNNSKIYVEYLVAKYNITPAKGSGCASVVLLFIIASIICSFAFAGIAFGQTEEVNSAKWTISDFGYTNPDSAVIKLSYLMYQQRGRLAPEMEVTAEYIQTITRYEKNIIYFKDITDVEVTLKAIHG